MTFGLGDVDAHQRLNFGGMKCTCLKTPHATTCPKSLTHDAAVPAPTTKKKLPQPVQMSRPELEMGMILEAQKRNNEIVDYRFQGMSLAYSEDPETGILLRYKCDYVVIVDSTLVWSEERKGHEFPFIKIIECKGHGPHAISAAAKLRFKGAKAAWPMFKFEMHQRQRDGKWERVL